jgi:hypothetical protein
VGARPGDRGRIGVGRLRRLEHEDDLDELVPGPPMLAELGLEHLAR